MKQYYKLDEWKIIEEGFNPEYNEVSESIFSLGNGFMGQRGNFEEEYSGSSLQGSYMAGIYYPDKTKVGWWKNGYPEYFAKIVNCTNWIGINFILDGEPLNLAKVKLKDFKRILNMKEGYLERSFTAILHDNKEIAVTVQRFLSMARKEIGAIKYSIIPLNFSGEINVIPYLDGNILNRYSNYEESFLSEVKKSSLPYRGYLTLKIKKTDFYICSYMLYDITKNNKKIDVVPKVFQDEKYISNEISITCYKNDVLTIYKYVANLSSRYYVFDELIEKSKNLCEDSKHTGFQALLVEQANAWEKIWNDKDIVINGDLHAQQGIRYNIFQLNQTYTGEDDSLNISPKGFTGEKYGGSTYWDTELFCIPYYLATSDKKIAKNLLLYRYKHLDKAIENAEKLGFSKGAALYPMVTINGEECHNEWEITFEEIHRNGAIAYAIYNYINYTGDNSYLIHYGFETLVAISRFWAQRVNFSNSKQKYVILGVTGPNEYENNVNNNWYTNFIASWTLEYTINVMDDLRKRCPEVLKKLELNLKIKNEEVEIWRKIKDNMYYPYDSELNIFLQQDDYMDKEQMLVKDLDSSNLPLNEKWSWDRILRSCFIKQADVLQGIYFFKDKFNLEAIRRNFNFYEPRTVHESSLSPSIHSILASKISAYNKAYELFLRTARLDLDNYNNDTADGCHITSMAGSCLVIFEGFAGMKVKDNKLYLAPYLPENWKYYTFKIFFRESLLNIKVSSDSIHLQNESNNFVSINIYNKDYTINPRNDLIVVSKSKD